MKDKRYIESIRPLCQYLKVVIIAVCKILFRLSYEGIEHIPRTGGVIIASNHASYIDPPAVGAIMPREVVFFAKKEIFSIPFIGQIISYSKSIPVDRYGFNTYAFREMIKRLKKGKLFLYSLRGQERKQAGPVNRK